MALDFADALRKDQRGLRRDKQFPGKRLEALRYRGAPYPPNPEKLLRSIRWEGRLSPLIFMGGTGPRGEWLVLPCVTRH